MSFTVPAEADAHHVHMSEIDQQDFEYIQEALKGNGVMSGCAVTAQGTPDMTVAVAAGSVRTTNMATNEVSAGNATITAADSTDPRIDIVVAAQDGTVAVRAGTPGSAPVHPSPTAGDIPIALVYIEANETAIESTMIVDKRLFPKGYIHVEKLSDESVASSNVLQDDDEMLFWIGANEVWFVAILMMEASGSATPDMKWGGTYPSGADIDMTIKGSRAHTAANASLSHHILTKGDIDGGVISLTGGQSTTSNVSTHFIYAVIENGATAGFFNLQWCQNVSNAAPTVMKAGSWLEAWKLVA